MTMNLSLYELIDAAVRKAQREAWDAGWQAHFWQHQKQHADSGHPIMKENPYT